MLVLQPAVQAALSYVTVKLFLPFGGLVTCATSCSAITVRKHSRTLMRPTSDERSNAMSNDKVESSFTIEDAKRGRKEFQYTVAKRTEDADLPLPVHGMPRLRGATQGEAVQT